MLLFFSLLILLISIQSMRKIVNDFISPTADLGLNRIRSVMLQKEQHILTILILFVSY